MNALIINCSPVKTGTAQVISSTGGYESGYYILSFLGIVPMNDPEIVCYIAIDKPQNTVQYGGVVAVAPKLLF